MAPTNRDVLIDAFELPRKLVRRGLIPSDCVFAGVYRQTVTCEDCFESVSCQWLADYEEQDMLHTKTDSQLIHALNTASELVTIHVLQQEHNPDTCGCEACIWLQGVSNFK